MAWLWSSTFLPYTVFRATSQQTGYEAAKVAVLDNHPYVRSWRSTSLAVNSVECRMSSIADPGFESSTGSTLSSSWATLVGTAGTHTATADTVTKRSGTYSMRLTCNASSFTFGRQQTVTVAPGVTYRFTAWRHMPTRVAGEHTIAVLDLTSSTTLFASTITGTTGGFTQVTGTFTVPAGLTSVTIRVFGNNTPNLTAYVDDLLLVPQVGAVALFNTNCPTITLGTSADAVSYSFSAPATMVKWWQYYRACWVQSPVIESEYIAIVTPSSGAALDSAAYWEVGALCFFPPLTSIKAPLRDMNEKIQRLYAKSGESVATAGPWRLEQEWQTIVQASAVQGVRDLALAGQTQPVIIFENQGAVQQCYLMRAIDDMTFTRAGKNLHQTVNPRFLELV